MSNRATDAAFAFGWGLTKRVPEPVGRVVFGQLADAAWRARGAGVRRLEANLARARPRLDPAGTRQLSRAAMRSYLRYWYEVFRLPVWSRRQVLDQVGVIGEDLLRGSYAAGRGVVVALPHTANWDLAGAWACLTGMPLTTVAERLEPERLFDRFVAYRRGLGMEVLPVTGGVFRALTERVRAGGLVCLVADRDLSTSGVEVRLLGEPARLPAGPAALARVTGAVLLPATLHYVDRAMQITIHQPVRPASGADGLARMTQAVADAFSAGIRAHPQDWHMLQRVFVADLAPRAESA